MERRVLAVCAGLVLVALAGLVPAAAGQTSAWAFRTPGDAAYCRFEGDILCVTPNDGFWIRFSGGFTNHVRITKGYSERWRGYQNRAVPLLRFDTAWLTSDAAVYTCASRRSGLTCNHFTGLAFWLGRLRGYRTYRGPPGSVPAVDPFFRTASGVWCGNSSPLKPTYMILSCWRQRDGAIVSLPHARRASRPLVHRNPHARDYRPRGFRLLRTGQTFGWRCRQVTTKYADQCAIGRAGTVVFTCRATGSALRCTNRFSRGFILGRHSIDPA